MRIDIIVALFFTGIALLTVAALAAGTVAAWACALEYYRKTRHLR